MFLNLLTLSSIDLIKLSFIKWCLKISERSLVYICLLGSRWWAVSCSGSSFAYTNPHCWSCSREGKCYYNSFSCANRWSWMLRRKRWTIIWHAENNWCYCPDSTKGRTSTMCLRDWWNYTGNANLLLIFWYDGTNVANLILTLFSWYMHQRWCIIGQCIPFARYMGCATKESCICSFISCH